MRLNSIIALGLTVAAVLPAHAAGIGRIKSVTGEATVERAGQKIAVKPGFVLEKGDRITTTKRSRVGMTFNDNSRFAAGPNSQMSITDFNFDDTTHAGNFTAQIDKGAVAIVSGHIAKSARDAMKISTPTALLGVRGTRFVVEVKGTL